MPETTRLHEMLAITAFGGVGIVLAVAMLLAAYVLVGREERARLRLPTALIAMHVLMVSVEWLLPDDFVVRRPMRVLAIALLLLSMPRSSFLLLVHVMVGRRGNAPLPKIIQDILQAVFYVGAGLVVLRAAGVEPTSLLTTSALLTAVIGLSLQDTLGNLFAGLAIQAQQPFEIGDWVELDTNIGRVVEINWRATKLLTIDNIEVTVPNGAVARASLQNHSRPVPQVRRAVTITVGPEVPPAEVHRIFREALEGAPGVLEQPEPDVLTVGFSDLGVEYRVRFWLTELDRMQPIESAVRDRLWYALQRAELGLPGARRHVLVQQATREARAEEQAQHTQERSNALHAVDFLRDVPEPAMEQLAASTARRMYGPGEVVLVEGSEGSELFVVESGEVEIIVTRDRAEPARVATVGPGRFFGEMSLMTGERRRATVRTLTQTVLLVVGKKDLQPILEAHPAIAQRISEVLAERDVALGNVVARDSKEHKSIIEQRSDALLGRIRAFFSL